MPSKSRGRVSKARQNRKRGEAPASRGDDRRAPAADHSRLVQLLGGRLRLTSMSWLTGSGERLVVMGPLEPEEDHSRLTATEEDVLLMLIAAKSNEQIARERRRSSRTVANQVKSIFRKLGVSSRRELFARVFQRTPPA